MKAEPLPRLGCRPVQGSGQGSHHDSPLCWVTGDNGDRGCYPPASWAPHPRAQRGSDTSSSARAGGCACKWAPQGEGQRENRLGLSPSVHIAPSPHPSGVPHKALFLPCQRVRQGTKWRQRGCGPGDSDSGEWASELDPAAQGPGNWGALRRGGAGRLRGTGQPARPIS